LGVWTDSTPTIGALQHMVSESFTILAVALLKTLIKLH